MSNNEDLGMLRCTGKNSEKRNISSPMDWWEWIKTMVCSLLFVLVAPSYGAANIPRIALSPDGRFVAYSYCEGSCGIAEVDLKNQSRVIYRVKDGSIQAPSYSPSGLNLIATYVTKPDDKHIRNIASIDRKNHTFTRITKTPFQEFSPVFCGGDKKIIYSKALGESKGRIPVSNIDIYEADIQNGIKIRQVTNSNFSVVSGVVCVDGGVVFSTLIDGHEQVLFFDKKSENVTNINLGKNDMFLQGGNRKKLLAVRRMGSDFSLVTFDIHGNLIMEIRDSGYIGRAAISENGNHLAYTKGQGGSEINIIDLVSSGRVAHKINNPIPSIFINLEEKKHVDIR